MPPWKLHWKHLYDDVVTSGLCTGCAGCVIACPHDVLGYDGGYRPFHLEEEGGPGGCVHGDKGCTLCARACPRFGDWETDADQQLWGRSRSENEPEGVSKDILLCRTTNADWLEAAQDGGLCTAILIWCLRNDIIDAALVSNLEGDGSTWKPEAGIARSEDEILAAAGSRYTYSANTLGYAEAVKGGAERIALVGTGCQASLPVMMQTRGVRKVSRRIVLSLGLLCSKTFDDAIFEELIEGEYGIKRSEISKMNIKGRLQLWLTGDRYEEIPLKECQPFTREGCKLCPDFAAEHADISMGGLGQSDGWTLTLVRTETGREILEKMIAEGWVEARPGDSDPAAVELMRKLAVKQRKRWPDRDAAPAAGS